MEIEALVEKLDAEWADGGFFSLVRDGLFDVPRGDRVLEILRAIDIKENDYVPSRLLSLIWFMPSFLEWQVDRVRERGGDTDSYRRFITEVHNTLERSVGVP